MTFTRPPAVAFWCWIRPCWIFPRPASGSGLQTVDRRATFCPIRSGGKFAVSGSTARALRAGFSATIAAEYDFSGGRRCRHPSDRVIMQAEQLKDLVISALEDVKAQDVSVIDVRNRTSVTDYMVLASGTSNRHVKSLAESVVAEAKEQGVRASNVEGSNVSDWILVDLGDVVVHVMMPATREFYDLERLWRDAPDLGVAGSE